MRLEQDASRLGRHCEAAHAQLGLDVENVVLLPRHVEGDQVGVGREFLVLLHLPDLRATVARAAVGRAETLHCVAAAVVAGHHSEGLNPIYGL